ncbi:unnamed protein product [Agarophyton chilense]
MPNSLEMHHFQGFQGPDECIWVVGAWTGPYPNEETINNIWRYCPDSGKWFEGDPIARPRGSGGAFFHNGKVYIVTGNVGGHREGAMVVPWFDSYDPKTGKWEQLPDIPHARDHCHAVVKNNRVYVAGGRRSTSSAPEFFEDTVAEVDVYDFRSGKWSTITSLHRPRGGTASTVYNDRVYLIGGEGDNRAWTEVDVLENDGFVQGISLPEPRHGTGVISCNGAIWIAGGARVLGGGNNADETYAFFEGSHPPPCRNTLEEKQNRPTVPEDGIGLADVSKKPAVTGASSDITTPAPSNQIMNSVLISPRPSLIDPVASSSPKVPPSSETSFADVEMDSISIEISPESSPNLGPSTSESEPLEPTKTLISPSEEVPVEEMSGESRARDRENSGRDESAAVLESSAESYTQSETSDSGESLKASQMTTEDELVMESPKATLTTDLVKNATELPEASSAAVEVAYAAESPVISTMESEVEHTTEAPKELPKTDAVASVGGFPELPPAAVEVEAVSISPMASTTVFEVQHATESSKASSLTVEVDFSPASSSLEMASPWKPESPAPVGAQSSPMTALVSASVQPSPTPALLGFPSSTDSEGTQPFDKSSSESSITEDEMSQELPTDLSSESTTLIETNPNNESLLIGSEEPQESNFLAEEEELFVGLESSSEDFADETNSCFPSDALVELQDGSKKLMALLRIGESVKVAHPDEFSKVFFFSHKHPEKNSEFLELKTSVEGVSLTLSPGHLVYANGVLVKASDVQRGDELSIGKDAKTAVVIGISRIRKSGLHNPHTLHGDIVVNGVVASTLTSAVHPSLATLLLHPFKAAFHVLRNNEHMETLNTWALCALERAWWGINA